MNYPKTKFLGKTWVGWLNIAVVQWFFVRVQGIINDDGSTTWSVIYPVVPWTGWWSGYIPQRHFTKVFVRHQVANGD